VSGATVTRQEPERTAGPIRTLTATTPGAGPTDEGGLLSVGRLPMHSLRRAAEIDLDGEWWFQLVHSGSAPDDGAWRAVRIPSLWTMQERSDPLHVETVNGPKGHVQIPTPPIAAGTEHELHIPAALATLTRTAAALAITLTVRTRDEAPWAPAGTTVAVEQIRLPHRPGPVPAGTHPRRLGERGEITHPLLVRPASLRLWRALTDNDGSFSLDRRFVRSGFFRLTPAHVEVTDELDGVAVMTRYVAAFGDEIRLS